MPKRKPSKNHPSKKAPPLKPALSKPKPLKTSSLFQNTPAKVVLLGFSQSGKTSLIYQYVIGLFPKPGITLRDGFMRKLLITDGRSVKFTIWDPSGEKLESSSSMHLQDADAVLICFSVGDLGSFEAKEYYLDLARKESPSDASIILVGNKCDIKEDEERVVAYEEAEEFARKHDLTYIEVSSKENINVSEIFEMIAKEKLRRVDTEKQKEEEDLKKKDSYCSMF